MARRYSVNFAGQSFGFAVPDTVDEEGKAETESVLADYFPELKIKVAPKGTRGGRLGRSSEQTTAEMTLKQKEAAVTGGGSLTNIINMPTATLPKPEAKPKTFEGLIGTARISEIGEKGFGLKDLSAALDAGYSMESIKDYINRNKENLYNIGPGAQEALGIKGYVSTAPGAFDYTQYGQSGFGMKDVEALRAKGVDTETMRRLAANAPMVGPEAAKLLGYTPTSAQISASQAAAAPASSSYSEPSYSPPSAPSFNYAAYGQGGFGMEDVKALQAQGASTEKMREIARNAPGGQIGPEARRLLGL